MRSFKKLRSLLYIIIYIFLGSSVFALETIFGDPGEISGDGKKSKRARKKFGRRKGGKEAKNNLGKYHI